MLILIAIIKNETIGMCLPRYAHGFSFYKLKSRAIGVFNFNIFDPAFSSLEKIFILCRYREGGRLKCRTK
ncbi:hypothetical protein A2V47_01545 [Candidatus Atribacteria bacterium RBG_19FT_COMBO_35_14]|uniref:Uncharacterized protein n=1 Tax=Candidatus Sediminicultor quintus TaxID=1797291 RepID=A0A1F5A865_9BACT|nr:MAG: hypothetical protein A2V47_01545 [Candidatus Atribacteria bacterium RBG_19FT_COMBO_35_14]